ncbi:uncharacterized protein J3R85_009567 [Psidium guajava]|nr:uncharacterized protein J3R85_009567 [Psidium guajava]
MDKTKRLIGSRSREGLRAFNLEVAQQLMLLRQPSDEERCNNSSQGSNSLSGTVKGQSKGSNHQGKSEPRATAKKRTKAALDQGESLLPPKKRKYRSVVKIYAETEPVDAAEDE